MLKYILKKCLELMTVMFLISFFAFAVIQMAPGDVSSHYITLNMTPEEILEIREQLGVDRSFLEQYLSWLKLAIQGDFGASMINRLEVAPQIAQRLPATLLLMGVSLFISVIVSVILGLIAGLKKHTWIDYIISCLAYIGMSVPSFWLGMILISFFTGMLHILPASGMTSVNVNTLSDRILHLIMPCLTLSLGNLAIFVRYVRTNTISQLGEEYVLTAMAKGTSKTKILFRHVLKNTLLPIITLLGMNLSSMVCGSFIVESIFGWPGIGTFAMRAIQARDYPIIMAYVLLAGFILVMGNFIADILYAIVDPRINRGAVKDGK